MPYRGLKTCSVIAATCVRTGDLLFDIGEKFQKQDDVRKFLTKILVETPPGKKVAILWDNASSHKAKSVRRFCEGMDITTIFNVAYHPQYNGIEHVFSDVRRRYRKKLTEVKISGVTDIDLKELVT